MMKKGIAILGSTGSIGTQTLDVISQHRDRYSVELLTAGSNSSLLIRQAIEFDANAVVICDSRKYEEVRDALAPHGIKTFTGTESICDAVKADCIDTVVAAMVGFSGLKPAMSAIEAGKTLALANKETLVAAGSIIRSLCMKHKARILPVDSEHSAIFQCLNGEVSDMEKVILTASGGPFLHTPKEEMFNAGKEAALKHPRWKMGAKVTIDSATMMNKGLEMIEARWLFSLRPEEIEIIIHPQSIIHSMVQFKDGTVMAQMSHPDMRIPIQYSLAYPERPELNTTRLDFSVLSGLTFHKPDTDRFPAIDIAYSAIRKGGNMPCIMNAANEIAVSSFLEDRIRFGEITDIVHETMEKSCFIQEPSIEDIFSSDEAARETARRITETKIKESTKWK